MSSSVPSKPSRRKAGILAGCIIALLLSGIWFASHESATPQSGNPHPKDFHRLEIPGGSAQTVHTGIPAPIEMKKWSSANESAVHAGFCEWVGRYLAADVAERRLLVDEGTRLAAARKNWLAKQVYADSSLAFRAAVPDRVRDQPPASVVRHLESRVNAAGFLNVEISCGHEDQAGHHQCTEAKFHRQIHVDGVSYEAVPLGSAEDLPSQPFDVNGVALPAADESTTPLMVFSPWSARIVEPGSPTEGPVTVERAGKQTVYPSLAEAKAAETGLPPGDWDELAYAGPDLREPTTTSPMPNGNGGVSGSADTTMSKGINRHSHPRRPIILFPGSKPRDRFLYYLIARAPPSAFVDVNHGIAGPG